MFKAAAKASLALGPGEIQLSPKEVQMEPLLRENPDRCIRFTCPLSAHPPLPTGGTFTLPTFFFLSRHFSFLTSNAIHNTKPAHTTRLCPAHRFVVLPIQYPRVWEMYKKAMGQFIPLCSLRAPPSHLSLPNQPRYFGLL